MNMDILTNPVLRTAAEITERTLLASKILLFGLTGTVNRLNTTGVEELQPCLEINGVDTTSMDSVSLRVETVKEGPVTGAFGEANKTVITAPGRAKSRPVVGRLV